MILTSDGEGEWAGEFRIAVGPESHTRDAEGVGQAGEFGCVIDLLESAAECERKCVIRVSFRLCESWERRPEC